MIQRYVLGFGIGLLMGSLLVQACGCPSYPPWKGGTFQAKSVGPESNSQVIEPDYELSLSIDLQTITEHYTRDGKRYEVQYSRASQ